MKIKQLIFLLIMIIFVGCKAQQPCIPTEIVRDSIRVEYKLDSVYLYERDSIYLEKSKDTVYKEVFKFRYKDKLILKHDTIYQDNTIEKTNTIKYIPKFYKVCTIAFFILLLLIIAHFVLKLLVKIYIK